ncbi:MAG: hypothetical protein FWD61_03895 [Phycisphaerales bacterium]|nr:hypothetical protein [Phycisphaerales bacterium]
MIGNQPLIVSYGAGRDSTAMLIEMHRRGIRPDVILFANVGSEKQATYRFIPVFDQWLKDHGFPGITIVAYRPKWAPYHTLEGNMILNATLPGATFNMHTCAVKFKIEPQQRWTGHWGPARRAWSRGIKVLKYIGFDCDETHRLKDADAKAHSGEADPKEQERFEHHMPLMEWGINLEKCKEIIDAAGLPIPPKSACFFCPSQKPQEVNDAEPEDRARTILMEYAAEPYNRKVRGLWRRPRLSDGRPGSITEYILERRLPFTPLTLLGRQIVLNPNCQKARKGSTFRGPHMGPSLRELLVAAGHEVPEVVMDGNSNVPAYREDRRGVELSAEDEDEEHRTLFSSL